MQEGQTDKSIWNPQRSLALRYLAAVALVALAVGLRVWPLGQLELRIPWLTFYPAIMAASLFGRFNIGLLSTALSDRGRAYRL